MSCGLRPKRMHLVLNALVSISYPAVIRYLCSTCGVCILSPYVLYGLTGSCPLHTPLLERYSNGICLVHVLLSVVLIVTCPLDIRLRGTPTDDRRIWTDMNRASTEQVMDKYWTKRMGTDNERNTLRIVVRWLSVRNFEHAEICPTDNGHQRTCNE